VIRSHSAGMLRAKHTGTAVTLAGWVAHRRDHGGVAFVDLRDASGVVQVVVRDEALAAELRTEYCVLVVGEVAARPAGNANPELPTGAVEVIASSVTVLSTSDPLPFSLDADAQVSEEIRLTYRYLDFRREGGTENLRLRSRANRIAREVLDRHEFVEVETPYLTRSTPEGARDFLVPVRLQPGSWYALPQSPQLFKQLLMVAGMERYYQLVRCFRDEDSRADRQPEFTQLDIEMSFVEPDDVMRLTEEVVSELWKQLLQVEIPQPIRRMTYQESMTRFGSDRPDLRFGCELVDVTEYFSGTAFRVFHADHVGAVVMPGGATQTRKELDGWQEWARARGARGLGYVVVGEGGELTGPVAKNLSDTERAGLPAATQAAPGDCIFFAAGNRAATLTLLGAARLELGRRCRLIDPTRWEFVWVVDFPLFDPDGAGGWTATHHPFTAPHPDWVDRFTDDPGAALACAYDVVVNGTELGGGSLRIHSADVQRRIFDVIGLEANQARTQFGFLLDALRFGPPPHGGIALGWDRLCAHLAGTESIRDVIAFPKTASGGDPLTGAPTPITAAQRAEAGVDASS
jgi:aspartyl-tRNA synthetase